MATGQFAMLQIERENEIRDAIFVANALAAFRGKYGAETLQQVIDYEAAIASGQRRILIDDVAADLKGGG